MPSFLPTNLCDKTTLLDESHAVVGEMGGWGAGGGRSWHDTQGPLESSGRVDWELGWERRGWGSLLQSLVLEMPGAAAISWDTLRSSESNSTVELLAGGKRQS